METTIEGLKISYDVRQSSEASKARIDHKLGEFTVVIPEDSDLDAEDLLSRKERWVSKKRKEFLQFKRKIPDRNIVEGGTITVLGDEKEIIVEKRRSNEVSDSIYLAEHLVNQTSVEDQMRKTLRKEAKRNIQNKIETYSAEINESFDKVYIRNQQTRWGSCSSKGNLNFNWRLILGPEHVLEYVVVHELVHLEEQNHDENFWSRVREIFPEYKNSNRWLSENSSKLVFNEDRINENVSN